MSGLWKKRGRKSFGARVGRTFRLESVSKVVEPRSHRQFEVRSPVHLAGT